MTRDQEKYENKLRHLGYQRLGSGLYSNVFAKPHSDKAVKVGSIDSWPDYAKWLIEKGYSGTFGPKIYSLKFYEDFYVASMERLVDTVGGMQADYDHISNPPNDLWQMFRALRKWLGSYSPDELPQNPDFQAFMRELDEEGLAGDLHAGNVMIRKDGSLVVTDPSARHSHSRFRIKNGTVSYLE
jgi:hypothetical protein